MTRCPCPVHICVAALLVAVTAPVHAAKVYWSDGLGIHRANLDGTDREDLLGNDAYAVRLDLERGKMYWSDHGVLRADLDGKNVETLGTDPTGVAVDLALDTTNEFAYWTNPPGDAVRRVSFAGGEVQTVVPPNPLDGRSYGLALDLDHGKLYWSETGALAGGAILRGNLDGSQPEPILPDHVGGPTFLAVDPAAGWLYWTAQADDIGMGRRIARARLDGSSVETLIDGLTSRSLVLDLVAQRMLWTKDSAIYSANLDGTDIQKLFETPGAFPSGLALDTTIPGDANGDRQVDLGDFGLLKANFGTGTRRSQGDFNADHQVDLADFGLLKANFGAGGAAAVPEPSAAMLAALGACGALAAALRRRGRLAFSRPDSRASSART